MIARRAGRIARGDLDIQPTIIDDQLAAIERAAANEAKPKGARFAAPASPTSDPTKCPYVAIGHELWPRSLT